MRRLACCLVILGALAASSRPAWAQGNSPFSSDCNPVRFNGSRNEPIIERPGAIRWTLSGEVSAVCGDTTIFTDELVVEDDTQRVIATGHVTFRQADLTMYAERADLNWKTKLGTFFQASGTARLGSGPATAAPFGTQDPDVIFHGEEITKVGPKKYRLKGGAFTSCVQPTPRWEMVGSEATIALDEYVLMKHMVFKVKDVPLLYLPGMYYPINKDGRSTGFLLPTYGSSTIGGTSLINAFFWAINRSHDATFTHTWASKIGQEYSAEYRYVTSPGSQGRMDVHLLNEKGLSVGGSPATATPSRSLRINGGMAQALPRGFYLSGNANYFTNIATQQRYQNIEDYSQRTRAWAATLAGNIRRVRVSVSANQNDTFYGTTQGQRTGALPLVNLSLTDRPIGRSRVYYGVTGEGGYLVRHDNVLDPATNRSLVRIDARPTLRAPLSKLPYLTATGVVSWRFTRWFESLDPITEQQVSVPLTRQLFEMSANFVGPVVGRVFQTPNNGYATRFKHVIEPRFSISRTTAFENLDRVVQFDYSDYLVGGTTRIDYGLANKLLARRRGPAAPAGAPESPGFIREILTVDLRQSYYSDARAQLYDTEYQTSGSTSARRGTFGALQMITRFRPTDTTMNEFKMEIDSKYRKVRQYTANSTIESPHTQVSAGWSKRQVIPELPGFTAEYATHFVNAATTVRTADNRWNGNYAMNFNVRDRAFLNQRIAVSYNSQCCGISFDWQSISTPLYATANDRRFGIAFTLAGIGAISNPMGAMGAR